MAELPAVLVGYGYSGRVMHAPLIAATPGLRLAGVVSSRAEPIVVQGVEVPRLSLGAVLADPDLPLVILATPTGAHAELAARCLRAGKHVVVEKPLAASAAEAHGLGELARTQGLVLSAFHNRRWDADFLTLKDLVDRGILGEIVGFEARWSRWRPAVRDRWRERDEPGAGVWFDLGSHLVDQMLQLFGRPAWVQADLAAQRPGAGAPDYLHVVFGYASGLRAVLHASSLAPEPEPRYRLHGRAGAYVKHGLDTQEAALLRGERPGEPGWGEDPAPGRLTTPFDGAEPREDAWPNRRGDWRAYYRALVEALAGRGAVPVSGEEAAEVVRLLELAADSSALGRRLPV